MKIANFSEISAYYNGKNTMNSWSNTFDRGGAFPIEKYSVFNSLSDAQIYVNGGIVPNMGNADGKAYDGQIIAVKDSATGVQKAYIIDSSVITGDTPGLTPVGDTSDILPVLDTLSDAISANIDAIQANATKITTISGEIKSIKDATLGDLTELENRLSSNLSVTVEELATANEGYLKTYVIKQAGTQVGVPINIPKDFLVKSATVKTCETAGDPVAEYKVGDKYLDFVLNTADTVDGTGVDKHVYIKLTDLAYIYKGGSTDTITVNVIDDTITATLNDNSVTTSKIVDNAITTNKLSAESVTTAKIAPNAVKTSKIDDYAVTNVKIAEDAITTSKIATNAIISDHLSAESVTTAKIAPNAVKTSKIDDYAVTNVKIAESAVTLDKLSSDITGYFATKSALETEAKARSDADAALDKRITDNATAIANELTAREAAINTVDSKAEKNAQDIEAESSRAIAQENVISAKIDAEIERSAAADNQHTTDIGQLRTDLNLSVGNLENRIDNIAGDLTDVYATKDELNAVSDALALSANNLSVRIESINTSLADYAKTSDVEAIDTAYKAADETITSKVNEVSGNLGELTTEVGTISGNLESLTGKVETISTDLGELTTEVETISGNLDGLTEKVETISTDLGELTTEVGTKLATSEFAELSVKIGLNAASETDKVATQSYVTAAVADLEKAMHFVGVEPTLPEGDALSAYKAGDVIIVGTTEYVLVDKDDVKSWVELGDEGNYATKAELALEREERIAADDYLSGAIEAICANYATKAEVESVSVALSNDYVAKVEALSTALSTDLKTEIEARTAADNIISTAIDNKVWAGDYADGLTQAESLSVVKISQADYHALVADPSGSKADPNAIYIVNAEGSYNMYGEKIVELSTTGVDGVAEAANVTYVDQAIATAMEITVINGGSATE